jgi:hypothetical protein
MKIANENIIKNFTAKLSLRFDNRAELGFVLFSVSFAERTHIFELLYILEQCFPKRAVVPHGVSGIT